LIQDRNSNRLAIVLDVPLVIDVQEERGANLGETEDLLKILGIVLRENEAARSAEAGRIGDVPWLRICIRKNVSTTGSK